MKKTFNHIALVMREGRAACPYPWSQNELSTALGYLNGQFVSNMERGLCSLPVKKVALLSKALRIPVSVIKEAMMKDEAENFDRIVGAEMNRIEDKEAHESVISETH